MCGKVTESDRNPRSLLVSGKSEVAETRRTPRRTSPSRQPRLPVLGKRDYRVFVQATWGGSPLCIVAEHKDFQVGVVPSNRYLVAMTEYGNETACDNCGDEWDDLTPVLTRLGVTLYCQECLREWEKKK